MLAAHGGYLDVTRLLLEARADKDLADRKGRTALLLASQQGHAQVLHLLKGAASRGASANGMGIMTIGVCIKGMIWCSWKP